MIGHHAVSEDSPRIAVEFLDLSGHDGGPLLSFEQGPLVIGTSRKKRDDSWLRIDPLVESDLCPSGRWVWHTGILSGAGRLVGEGVKPSPTNLTDHPCQRGRVETYS